jgi:hypothetical protein
MFPSLFTSQARIFKSARKWDTTHWNEGNKQSCKTSLVVSSFYYFEKGSFLTQQAMRCIDVLYSVPMVTPET